MNSPAASDKKKPKTVTIDCPTCKKEDTWHPENRYRPFCSDRCRLIDLGGWADGSYAVPTADSQSSADESEDR
ncbi:MAG: DNA gyrase inhibitor YacG [Pseudomonadota bacterium]